MKNLKWIIHRASIMPYEEYIYRIKNLSSNIFEFLLLKTKYNFNKIDLNFPKKEIITKSIFPEDIQKILPYEYKELCLLEANKIINNRFSFFDLQDHFLGNKINWNFDYKNKKLFPLHYPFLGSHLFKKIGDIKYVFEINKHQELVRLSEAYVLTEDPSYLNKIIENIQDWILQCPYKYGVNWSSPTVMAYRLISWTICFEILRKYNCFSKSFLYKWIESVFQHIRLIRRNYSKFSSAGNHLISEATSVFIASLRWKIFFAGKEANFLNFAQKEAYAILLKEIKIQILADGVNHEQAVAYQVFTANQFFLSLYFGRKSDIDFPDWYSDRLYNCVKFLASILNKNGNPPNFGDEDNAWAFRFCDRKTNKYLDQLSVFSLCFNDFSLMEYYPLSETTYWLFGAEAVKFNQMRTKRRCLTYKEKDGLKENVFPIGGYYLAAINRGMTDEILIFFDFGPVGTKSTGAHGHADALNICLSLGGRWVFIDAGTYHYKDSLKRKALRVTSAHNTLHFGELSSQDEYLGPFLWGKRHKCSGESLGIGHFKGSVTWYDLQRHSREIKVFYDKLIIIDSWDSNCFPHISFTISHDLSQFVSFEKDNLILINSKKFTCYLKADNCSIVVDDIKISPEFYQLANSKRITIHPKMCLGTQSIEIGWMFN